MQTTPNPQTTRPDQTLPTLLRREVPPATHSELRLEAFGGTHVGHVRERNEDQFLLARLGRWMNIEAASIPGATGALHTPQGTLLVVADGMGGQGAGDVASAVVLDAFVGHSLTQMPWLASGTPEGDALLARDLSETVAHCQERLREVAQRKGLPRRLGTTFTALYVDGARAVIAHVGDTRAYRLRGGVLEQLTRDHTLAADLAALAPHGAPPSSAHQNVLTNAIGGTSEQPVVELRSVELQAGDRLLLSSDGLHSLLDEALLTQLLWTTDDAPRAVHALLTAALERGAPDNVTAVVARVI